MDKFDKEEKPEQLALNEKDKSYYMSDEGEFIVDINNAFQ